MTLPCYNFYTVPTIRTRPSYREKFPMEKKGSAAVGVLRHIPQAQLDTSKLCSEEREVVAVRLKNGKQRLVVASIYIRPKAKPEEGETKSWIRELLELADKDQLVVGGDFNAQHRDWGYRINTRKGRDIAEAMEEIGRTLRNESGVKTRLAKQARQHDTTPDLTWALKSLPLRWTSWRDNLGSDHYPIDVTIEQHKDGRTKEARPIIRWNHFREILLQNLDGRSSIEASIQQAMSKARTTVMVKPGDPTPDMHLLNLWASRLQALQLFRRNRTTRHKVKLNLASVKATRYSKELSRHKWRSHCESFNSRTGLGKAWRTYRGMEAKKRRTRNAAQNLALRLNITEDELATQAAQLFFPQANLHDRTMRHNRRGWREALRACRDSKPKSRTAKGIKAIARELKAKGIVLTLGWIPGHVQIPGNEWAHQVAAEAASSNSSATGSTTDNEETEDPVEKAKLARQARKPTSGDSYRLRKTHYQMDTEDGKRPDFAESEPALH
ncbi:hypothetical protein HPB47_020977 [Ixodes persulcatus]|uniref:Uncharacterized protein n=1 Tax=Ixodes persulcatus TaxID=34615 RepID=A0AC60QEP0_IXOPE|nr:hypothetical protein HPB47_020977 [Ixodes persulcatus]